MTSNQTSSTGTNNPTTIESSRRIAIAAGVGTAIEWYDYGLYALVAGVVIGPTFFPESHGAVGLMASFATFAVGFLARPVGGIVLGAAADRLGRKPILMFSIILIGVATTLIGCLPSFAAIGIWAPILLVALRLAQGFGAGAELAGAMTIINESAVPHRKSLFSSFSMSGNGVGSLLAFLVFATTSSALSPSSFADWGWRIPFLLSAVLTLVGIYLRRSLTESPEFLEVERRRREGELRESRRNPIIASYQAFVASPRNWTAGFLIPSGMNITGYVVAAFGISYLIHEVGLSASHAIVVSLAAPLAMVVSVPFWGWLGDKVGSKRVLWVSIAGGITWAFPYFALLDTKNTAAIILATSVMMTFGWSGIAAGHAVLMPSFFKTEFRSAGLFASREIQGAVVAGPAPLIAAALLVVGNGSPWLVALFLVIGQLLTLGGTLLGRPWLSEAEVAAVPAYAGIARLS